MKKYYTVCDGCGREVEGDAPSTWYTVQRGDTKHYCSQKCLFETNIVKQLLEGRLIRDIYLCTDKDVTRFLRDAEEMLEKLFGHDWHIECNDVDPEKRTIDLEVMYG